MAAPILPIALTAVGLLWAASQTMEEPHMGPTPPLPQPQPQPERKTPPSAGPQLAPSMQLYPAAMGMEQLDPSQALVQMVDWDRPASRSITGFQLMQQLKDNRGTWVFQIPWSLKQIERDPHLAMDRKPKTQVHFIVIDDIASFRYFGKLYGTAMILLDSGDVKGVRQAEAIFNLFDYHDFQIGPNLKDLLATQIAQMACVQNPTLPEHTYRNAASNIAKPRKHFPVPDDPTHDTWEDTCVSFQTFSTTKQAAVIAQHYVGRNLLKEYGAARYAQVMFAGMVDPSLAKKAGLDLAKGLDGALGIAEKAIGALLTVAAGGTATLNPVGLIVAGVAAAIAGITGLANLMGAIEQTRKWRMAVSDKVDKILQAYNVPPFPIRNFSGYRMNVVIPEKAPWDDIQDALFGYFAIGWTQLVYPPAPTGWDMDNNPYGGVPFHGVSYATPQMPFYYLQIDFPLPVSVAQPSGNLLVLDPVLDSDTGQTFGFSLVEYTAEQFANVLKKAS